MREITAKVKVPIKGDKSGNKVGLEIDVTQTVLDKVKREIYLKCNDIYILIIL